MLKKLFNCSFDLLILGMLFLMFSEVRCGNFQSKDTSAPASAPKKAADRQLASVPAGSICFVRLASLYPEADGTGIAPGAIGRIRKYLAVCVKTDKSCRGKSHVP